MDKMERWECWGEEKAERNGEGLRAGRAVPGVDC